MHPPPPPTPTRLLFIGIGLILISLTSHPLVVNAYRIGDAVGILLRTQTPSNGSSTLEAFRHQLPRFGVSTKTRFDVASLLNPDDIRLNEDNSGRRKQNQKRPPKNEGGELADEHLRLSLSFDEGFHHIPWLEVYNTHRQKILENLIVTIVYSGSDGSIHAVHRETKYQDPPAPGRRVKNVAPKSFTVEYVWVNEADVDVQSGLLALFIAVLFVSLSGMVGACISSADEDGGRSPANKGKKYKDKHSSPSLGAGGDGFAKGL